MPSCTRRVQARLAHERGINRHIKTGPLVQAGTLGATARRLKAGWSGALLGGYASKPKRPFVAREHGANPALVLLPAFPWYGISVLPGVDPGSSACGVPTVSVSASCWRSPENGLFEDPLVTK